MISTLVIMLILRLKYKSSQKHQQQQRDNRRASTSSNNGFTAPSNNRKCNKNDPDEEEYYCLRPTGTTSKPTVVATSSRGYKSDRSDDRNPDVIPGSGGIHVNIHAPGIFFTVKVNIFYDF